MYTYSRLKRVLLGESLPTSASVHERLSNATGLAVLASDALSSVAYMGVILGLMFLGIS